MSRRLAHTYPIVWALFLTLLIGGPWLLPGYIFGTDFAGPRHFQLPSGPSSYAGLQLALGNASHVFAAEIVGKLLIFAILLVAGLAAYWAVPVGPFLPRAIASLVYVFNPFVYDRLAYGQLTVLAGYASLPLVALATRRLLIEPSPIRALVAGAVLAVVGILDIHVALIAAVLVALMTITHLAIGRPDLRALVRIGQNVILAGAVALIVSSYWLIPVLAGKGPEARTLAGIGTGDLTAFSTIGDPQWGLLPNVLGLYGFWAEGTGRFTSMKEFAPAWPAALAILLAIAAIGAVYTWRRKSDFAGARSWVAGLLVAAAVATILDIGISEPHVAGFITWLDTTVPVYRGMRDASKWGAVLALAYSQLAALGAIAVQHWADEWPKSASIRAFSAPLVVALLLAVPLYFGNGLLYGMHGQIRPSDYPVGWYTADRVLAADPDPGRAVFLPWHGYLALSFVRNHNRVVATPAPQFFSIPVVASQDLEVSGIPPNLDDPDQATVTTLVGGASTVDWGPALAKLNVKYVLLAREVDWARYSYLDTQGGLTKVGDYGSIVLYRNLLWKGPV